jgi:hypothetical protein
VAALSSAMVMWGSACAVLPIYMVLNDTGSNSVFLFGAEYVAWCLVKATGFDRFWFNQI